MDGADQLYQGPDGTALRFYSKPTKNNFHSERLGRPIFDTSLMVEVMVPGSRESTPEFEVERVYCPEVGLNADGSRVAERTAKYDQYRAQVEAFKAQDGAQLVGGTPLVQWPQIDAGTAATLRAAGIHSVEQLAAVADSNLQHLGMGGRVLREQAQQFLSTREFGVPSAQMAAEVANLRDTVAELQGRLADLTGINAALQAQVNATPPANATGTFGAMFGGATAPVSDVPPAPAAPAAPLVI